MNNDKRTEIEQKAKWLPWLYSAAAFVLIYICSLRYAAWADVYEYYFDSKYYWNLANVVFDNGDKPFIPIYILKYPQSIRGYFFPVLVGLFKYIFQGMKGWRILASLSMAGCFSFSLPFAVKNGPIDSIKELLRTLLAYVVFMWVWGNFMQYPLSDFFSFLLLLTAIAFLRILGKMKHIALKGIFGFFAGACLYAAYNTRTTFFYSALLVLLAVILQNRKKVRTLCVVMVTVLLGMAVMALPQCHINRYHEGVYSPRVFYDLVDSEVYRGIYTARYETYIGVSDAYPSVEAVFRDRAGTELIRREKLTEADFQLEQIFGLFLKYPLDMCGIYFRHLVSLLTPVYRQVYLTDIYAVDWVCILVSIMIWLAAGYGSIVQVHEKGFSVNGLFFLALCLPGLLQIFDEPELRFFLPIYVLAYDYVFVRIDYRHLFHHFRKHWLPVVIISLLILCFWISLTGDTLANLSSRPLLISNNSAYVLKNR